MRYLVWMTEMVFTSEVKNVEFSDGVDLKVSGVNIRLVPAKE